MIGDFSFQYLLLKIYLRFIHAIWYRSITVRGKENIPTDKPYIIAPNHQNALMDAMAILFSDKHQPVWLARADIFNRKTKPILSFLKIMPVYRIRDGADSLGRNEEIFNTSIEVLKKKVPLALFPEGTHNNKRQLLPLKKAVQRISFLAEEKNDFSLDIQIVPCGLYYSDYTNIRQDLIVNYGKAIPIKDYLELYKDNPQQAFQQLGQALGERLKKLMLHIPGKDNYETYELLRNIYRPNMLKNLSKKPTAFNKLQADQKTVELIQTLEKEAPSDLETLAQETSRYHYLIKKNKLRDWVVQKGPFSFWNFLFSELRGLLLLPFFLYGSIFNVLPFVLPNRYVRHTVKDPQFISSFNYVLAAIVFPVYYGLLTLLYSLLIGSYTWLFFLSLPLTGFLALQYLILFKKTYAKYVYTIGCWRKQSDFVELRALYRRITKKLDQYAETFPEGINKD